MSVDLHFDVLLCQHFCFELVKFNLFTIFSLKQTIPIYFTFTLFIYTNQMVHIGQIY